MNGLQKSYKQLHILKGVDFEVEKVSIFALLGSNGAGKTTIVKILTTLLKQDSGIALVSNAISVVVIMLVALVMGFRSPFSRNPLTILQSPASTPLSPPVSGR